MNILGFFENRRKGIFDTIIKSQRGIGVEGKSKKIEK